MTTNSDRFEVEGVEVELVRKRIKNLHLAVYPPDGRIRIAVPEHLSDEAARLAVLTRLPWIRRKQAALREQVRESERGMVSGESHYVDGRRYRLEVVEAEGKPSVEFRGDKRLRLNVKPGTDVAGRAAVLDRWYRDRLRQRAAPLIDAWSNKVGVVVEDWRIKRMKTRWGSCSVMSRRIWLNSELAKKSDRCLEYIVVHELLHLTEPGHNDRFRSLISQYLPSWESRRDELNESPLGFEDWTY